MRYPFTDVIDTEAGLRDVLGHPNERTVKKEIASLDKYCRQYIERSPFALIGTANSAGRCDVSPKGDAPGFVHVLDEKTLLIPERPGNKRGDTLSNIIDNPRAAVFFLVPTIDITLRVNGPAAIVKDPNVLQLLEAKGKTPELAIAVEAEEVFFHCAKAFMRSNLWSPEGWADQSDLPTLGQILLDHTAMEDVTVESLEEAIAESYATKMY